MNTPFSLTTTLIPVLVARLSPIAALGVAVQGLPDSRRESGFVANDAVTLAWIAWSPVQGAGNSVSGAVTQTITLNCRISVRKLSLRDQVADLLYQRLAGWQVAREHSCSMAAVKLSRRLTMTQTIARMCALPWWFRTGQGDGHS